MTQRILQTLSITFFTILSINLSAQNLYFGVQTGYGFATSAGQSDLVNIERIPDKTTYEAVKGGYGEGINIGVKIGYNFNKVIGFELNSDYLLGRQLTEETNEDFQNGSSSFSLYRREYYTTNMLKVSPQITFNAVSDSKLTPYAKVGLTFGLLTNVKSELEFTNIDLFTSTGIIKTNMERTSKGRIPIGLNSTLGTNYKLDDKKSLYVEFHLLNMSYLPKRIITTSYLINNEDRISDLDVYQKEQVYFDKIESSIIENDKPREFLQVTLPMSNVSFNFGLRIDL